MDHRLVVGTLLLLTTSLTAQKVEGQDPDRPQETSGQRFEQLTQERQRLELEIRYVKERAKDIRGVLAQKLAGGKPTFRSIDAGVNAPPVSAVPAAPQMRLARVATHEEMVGHPPNTMVVVNGRSIQRESFDAVVQYLGTLPNAGDEAMRSQRALFELLRIEAVASMFEPHDGEEKLAEVMTQVDGGKPLAELAATVGVVQGSGPDGKFEATHNSVFGAVFEQVAFRTEPGHKARPFRNAGGFVLLQVDSLEKGATPDLDKVLGTAVLVPYSGDAAAMQRAQMALTTGQVEILARDEQVLAMLPAMFRRPAPPTMRPALSPDEQAKLMEKLNTVQADMESLRGKDDEESKLRLRSLESEYGNLKSMLRSGLQNDVVTPADVSPPHKDEAPVVPPKAAEQKKQN